MSTLTDWFPPTVPPEQNGWYHTGAGPLDPSKNKSNESKWNWWWQNGVWLNYPPGEVGSYPAAEQARYWRGLTEKPA